MKKVLINTLLQKQYSNLEKKEEILRAELAGISEAKKQAMKALIVTLYQECTTKFGNIDYRQMYKPLPKNHSVVLKHRVEQASRLVNINDYPFTALSFDGLNRLDATQYELAIVEAEHAHEIYELYHHFLLGHVLTVAEETTTSVLMQYELKPKQIEKITTNKKYPVDKAIANRCYETSRTLTRQLQDAIMRCTPVDKALPLLMGYVERKDKNSIDKIIYTENTRVTNETVAEIIRPFAKAFRTVCVDDGKACETCLDIEDEQLHNPVPFEDFIAGATAPPFHPFCRCGYEIEWSDNND